MYRILLTADHRCHLANSLILEILIQTKALWKRSRRRPHLTSDIRLPTSSTLPTCHPKCIHFWLN